MDQVLRVQNLVKSYGNIKAVNNLTFTVNKGEIFGLLGPNGSGKSTTIRILLSLVKKDSGEIFLFNEPVTPAGYRLREKIGALAERPNFYEYLSAYENLKILAELSAKKIQPDEIVEKIKWVGLSDFTNRKVRIFSQGMKQRLGIAQALLNNPELIILDEPANGLDPHGIIEIRKIILNLSRKQGITIVLSSHILKEIEIIADRMAVMHHGKAIAEGNVKELLAGKGSQIKFRVNLPEKAAEVLSERGIKNVVINDYGELVVKTDDYGPGEINKYLVNAGVEVTAINPVRSLEDFYLQLTDYALESDAN